MNSYFSKGILISCLAAISLVLSFGCGSEERSNNNPTSSTPSMSYREKRQKVETTLKVVGNKIFSQDIFRPLQSPLKKAPSRQQTYFTSDYSSSKGDIALIDDVIEAVGPDSEGWYTIRWIGHEDPEVEKQEEKLRIFDREGNIVRYPTSEPDFGDKISRISQSKEEWKTTIMYFSGRKEEWLHTTIEHVVENIENIEDILDAVNVTISTKGTISIPLSDGSVYVISLISNENKAGGESTFTTSDNWMGKVEYKNDWETYTYPDGLVEQSLLGRTIKGYINDENGNKIAMIDYYENVQALGRYIYYIMIDDPNQEVHRIELY